MEVGVLLACLDVDTSQWSIVDALDDEKPLGVQVVRSRSTFTGGSEVAIFDLVVDCPLRPPWPPANWMCSFELLQ